MDVLKNWAIGLLSFFLLIALLAIGYSRYEVHTLHDEARRNHHTHAVEMNTLTRENQSLRRQLATAQADTEWFRSAWTEVSRGALNDLFDRIQARRTHEPAPPPSLLSHPHE